MIFVCLRYSEEVRTLYELVTFQDVLSCCIMSAILQEMHNNLPFTSPLLHSLPFSIFFLLFPSLLIFCSQLVDQAHQRAYLPLILSSIYLRSYPDFIFLIIICTGDKIDLHGHSYRSLELCVSVSRMHCTFCYCYCCLYV